MKFPSACFFLLGLISFPSGSNCFIKHVNKETEYPTFMRMDMNEMNTYYAEKKRQRRSIGLYGEYSNSSDTSKFKNLTDQVSVHLVKIPIDFKASSVSIEWVGNASADTSAILVVADKNQKSDTKTALFRSTDRGKTFKDLNDKIGGLTLDPDNTITKNKYFPDRVFLVGQGNKKFCRSKDAGLTYECLDFPSSFHGGKINFLFHPTLADTVIVMTHGNAKVHLSEDYGTSWKENVVQNAFAVNWGVPNVHPKGTVFFTKQKDTSRTRMVDLYQSTDMFKTSTLLRESIFDFVLLNKYLFVSLPDGRRLHLMVCEEFDSDGKPKWNTAHFPVKMDTDWEKQVANETGYQILDETNGTVFVNVDNVHAGVGEKGTKKQVSGLVGNLYKSDAAATAYTLSLKNHLFLTNIQSDFHKVKGLRGAYVTSQLISEQDQQPEFRSLISFDMGSHWRPLTPPDVDSDGQPYENCFDNDCYLHLHNSVTQHVTSGSVPSLFSLENAAGLLIGHGTVGKYLSLTAPRLFISRDGGFKWTEALKGVYSFAVADHGGLIVAMPVEEGFLDMFFSWDEGLNWNSVKVCNNKKMKINRVLTTPGSTSDSFTIWGDDGEGNWAIISIDFKDFLGAACKESDYYMWSPTDGRLSDQRCVLGFTTQYKKRKPTKQCFNTVGYKSETKNTPCQCVDLDFECNFGFHRQDIDSPCTKYEGYNAPDPAAGCDNGQTEYTPLNAYRKIAGDRCILGVSKNAPYSKADPIPCGGTHTPAAAIIIPTVVALAALMGIGFTVYIYNRKKNYWRSRYMELAQSDHDDEIGDTGLDFSDTDESDDDELLKK